MDDSLLRKAATIVDLKQRAKSRIPAYAFEYVAGGCNHDLAVINNRNQLDKVKLNPHYLRSCESIDLTSSIFGHRYDAPFGVAPIGLSGIIWPNASVIQAKAAHEFNIPFILSSVSTSSIEQAAQYAKENFWFQLYPPRDLSMRTDILRRVEKVGCQNLVVTIDVPSLSWRPSDIRNGLGIPPKITAKSLYQSALRPMWSMNTFKYGIPEFATLKPYIGEQLKLKEKAMQVRHALREVVDLEVLNQIRQHWQGNLIVKGILNLDDARLAVEAGADGIIVSNHGGRQLDAALSPIENLHAISTDLKSKTVVMADSGVESGIDVARYLACGAQMVFAGRAYMYGVAAFAEQGAMHTNHILSAELRQLMEQLRCASISRFQDHLIMPSV